MPGGCRDAEGGILLNLSFLESKSSRVYHEIRRRMNVKEDLHLLVDRLADSELETARTILERLHVDLDEDPVSPEEVVEIEESSAQIDRGEYVTLEEFERKHGS